MAIIFTSFDLATVFAFGSGIGAMIVQADEKDIETLCDTSYWLNWILCSSIFVIQCIIAFPIAQFYGDVRLVLPLCVAALAYLMLPLCMVHSSLIERENRFKVIALCNATQSIVSNVVTVVLVFFGMRVWAIVWAIVLGIPVWIIITWMNHTWRPPTAFRLDRWQEIVNYSKNLLGVELLNKMRMNLDYLIVGRFLGIEALGVYYFAFNAGIGISINVIDKFMWALFPYICAVREDHLQFKQRYLNSLKKITLTVVPLILLQSLLAPLYVPIIFGKKWVVAIPIIMMVCLSALPRIFAWASNLLLNATGKTHITLYLDTIFTIIFTASILIAAQGGIFWVAAAVLASHLLVLPVFVIWTHQYVLGISLRFNSKGT